MQLYVSRAIATLETLEPRLHSLLADRLTPFQPEAADYAHRLGGLIFWDIA